MSHTPPSTNPSPRKNRFWYIVSAVAVVVVLFFVFFPSENAETPTVDGNDNATIEGAPTSGTTPAPAPAN